MNPPSTQMLTCRLLCRRARSWLAVRRAPALVGLCLALAVPAHAETGGAALRAALADALVRPATHRFEAWRWASEPEVIVLYFGADWCAPCRELEPRLRAVYETLRARSLITEVVFVSLDGSERDALRHMQAGNMPWPALDRRRLPSIPALRRWAAQGTPNVVLLDRAGRVLASAWEGDTFQGTNHVLARWREYTAAVAVP